MFTKKTIALIAGCCLSAGVLAERPWPEREFICEVVTESGAQGVVFMQTFSKEHAAKDVLGFPAQTVVGTFDKTAEVEECIEPSEGEVFTDPNFRAWLETLEM